MGCSLVMFSMNTLDVLLFGRCGLIAAECRGLLRGVFPDFEYVMVDLNVLVITGLLLEFCIDRVISQ